MSPMGRPKIDNPKRINLGLRIDENLNEKLEAFAKKSKLPKTEIIRRALVKYLDEKK